MRPVLLDVNILIALFDSTHVHHQLTHDWFAENRARGWATCPLTQNGLIRMLSIVEPGRDADRPADLARHLASFCGASDHHFWPDTISLTDPARFDLSALRHRHVTDVYLAGLAHANGGTLATFDRTIPIKAVLGASAETLEIIRQR